MNKTDLQRLMENFTDDQLEIVGAIALRMAAARSERWTGKLTLEVNFSEGGLGDLGISHRDVIKVTKRRTVRSGGV